MASASNILADIEREVSQLLEKKQGLEQQVSVLQGLHKQLHDDIAELQPRYISMKAEWDKCQAIARELLASLPDEDA